MTYLEAKEILGNRDHKKVANNTYLVRRGPDTIGLRLHNTDVLTFTPTSVTYNTGGWRTVTTKARFNRFGAPGRVFSEDRVWYTRFNGVTAEYFDGFTYRDDDPANPPESSPMTPSRAVDLAENGPTDDPDYLTAWQYLIDSGLAWTLQGWFGRTAADLIAAGECHR